MLKFISRLFLFCMCLAGVEASAQNLDTYFYHFDDPKLEHRKATSLFLTPEGVVREEAGPPSSEQGIAVTMRFQMFCANTASNADCPRLTGTHNVKAGIDENIRNTLDRIEPHRHKVKIWHIIDEPYIRGVTKRDLETALNSLYWISRSRGYNVDGEDGIPLWVNFALNCYLDEPRHHDRCRDQKNARINQYGGDRDIDISVSAFAGIPWRANLVSFDWYASDYHADANEDSDCFGIQRVRDDDNSSNGNLAINGDNCHIDDHMTNQVIPNLNVLKSMTPGHHRFVLVPGTYTGVPHTVTAIGMNEALARYTDLANNESRVRGLVPFTFSDPDIDITMDDDPGNPWRSINELDADHAKQAEMFYQAIAISEIDGLKDPTLIPVFEYSDDREYEDAIFLPDSDDHTISPADSHHYTMGYETADKGVYSIRRLAFYAKTSRSGIYTRKIYRCEVERPNSRISVFFTTNSTCANNVGRQRGEGYVSPVRRGEADHRIIACNSPVRPYYDQAWTLLAPGKRGKDECEKVFGPGYNFFTVIGYSKAL